MPLSQHTISRLRHAVSRDRATYLDLRRLSRTVHHHRHISAARRQSIQFARGRAMLQDIAAGAEV